MPQDKPKIHLNLDTLERENAPEPFAVVLGGKRYVLDDAQQVDSRELLAAQLAYMNGDPTKSLQVVVPEADREKFFGNRLPNYKLTALFKAYNEHYGIDPGEASASPNS